MTRTTQSLSEHLPRIEKSRGDARAVKNDKASNVERATAKTTFGSMVKRIDGEADPVEKLAGAPENEKKLAETTVKLEPVKLRDPEPLQPQLKAANSLLRQPKPELQDAPKLALTAADKGSDEGDGGTAVVNRREQASGETRHDDLEMVDTPSIKAEAPSPSMKAKAPSSRAAPVVADVEPKASTEVRPRTEPAVAEVPVDEGYSEKQVSVVEPKVDTEKEGKTEARFEVAASANVPTSASAEQEPKDELPPRVLENSIETEHVEQLVADPDRLVAVVDRRQGSTETQQTSEAKTVLDAASRAEPVTGRLASDAYYALRRAPTPVIDKLDRPAAIAGHKPAIAEPVAVPAPPVRSEQIARLVDETTSAQRASSEPLDVSAFPVRPDLKARLVHDLTSAQRVSAEPSAVPTPAVLPELKARLVHETASARRSLGVHDQAVVTGNDIEAATLDLPSKAVQQEVNLSVGPSPGVGTANVHGQLVQSIASPDGLPRTAAELKLLATQGSTKFAPEPLKVLHIQLQPKELGEIAVRIALRGDKIELRVQTTRQATANLLMSDQRLLVEALQQRNFDIDSVTIQLVDPDRNSGAQSAALPNTAQGRSGQSESFLAGSQGQASRQHGGAGRQDGNSDAERRKQRQEVNVQDGVGQRRGLYL